MVECGMDLHVVAPLLQDIYIYMYARLFSSRCCGISMVVDAGIAYLSSYRILRVSCHAIGAPSEDISCLRQNVV